MLYPCRPKPSHKPAWPSCPAHYPCHCLQLPAAQAPSEEELGREDPYHRWAWKGRILTTGGQGGSLPQAGREGPYHRWAGRVLTTGGQGGSLPQVGWEDPYRRWAGRILTTGGLPFAWAGLMHGPTWCMVHLPPLVLLAILPPSLSPSLPPPIPPSPPLSHPPSLPGGKCAPTAHYLHLHPSAPLPPPLLAAVPPSSWPPTPHLAPHLVAPHLASHLDHHLAPLLAPPPHLAPTPAPSPPSGLLLQVLLELALLLQVEPDRGGPAAATPTSWQAARSPHTPPATHPHPIRAAASAASAMSAASAASATSAASAATGPPHGVGGWRTAVGPGVAAVATQHRVASTGPAAQHVGPAVETRHAGPVGAGHGPDPGPRTLPQWHAGPVGAGPGPGPRTLPQELAGLMASGSLQVRGLEAARGGGGRQGLCVWRGASGEQRVSRPAAMGGQLVVGSW